MPTASKLQRIKQRIDNQATILVADYMDYITHEPNIERQTKKYKDLELKWQQWLRKQTQVDYEMKVGLFTDLLIMTIKTANTYYAEQKVRHEAKKKTLKYKWKALIHKVVTWYVKVTAIKKPQS